MCWEWIVRMTTIIYDLFSLKCSHSVVLKSEAELCNQAFQFIGWGQIYSVWISFTHSLASDPFQLEASRHTMQFLHRSPHPHPICAAGPCSFSGRRRTFGRGCRRGWPQGPRREAYEWVGWMLMAVNGTSKWKPKLNLMANNG